MEAKKDKTSYKKALEEIQQIIDRLNSEDTDIDTISKDVKKAIELINICKAKLNNCEKELENLFKK